MTQIYKNTIELEVIYSSGKESQDSKNLSLSNKQMKRESDVKTRKNTLDPKHLVSIRRIQEKYKESEGNTKLDSREKSGKDKKIRKRDDKNC